MDTQKEPLYKPFYLIMLVITGLVCLVDAALSIGSLSRLTLMINYKMTVEIVSLTIMLLITIANMGSLILLFLKKFIGLVILYVSATTTCFVYFLFAFRDLSTYLNKPSYVTDAYSGAVDTFSESSSMAIISLVAAFIILLVSAAFCIAWYFAWKNQQGAQNNFNKEGSTVSNL